MNQVISNQFRKNEEKPEDTKKHSFSDIQKEVVVLPVILVLQAFFLAIGMQAITFADYNTLYEWFAAENRYYVLYNVLLFYIVLQLCVCLFKRLTPGYIIVAVFTVVISVINNWKWVNLKECVTLSDFEKLTEAATVAGETELNWSSDMWLWIVFGVLLLIVITLLDGGVFRKLQTNRTQIRICRIILLILVLVLIPVLAVDAKQSTIAKLTESKSGEQTGPVLYFIESIFTSGLDETYSLEEAKESYNAYVEQGKKIVEKETGQDAEKQRMAGENGTTGQGESVTKPNVIVVMSEAFYDVNRFEGVLSYSENPMAAFEEVQSQSISGNAMVNIYGGSTHFSEFEFLTGWNSKSMNSGSCPYKEYFNQEQPSFAGYLQEQGYYTLAIHPYDSYFWNRKNAYPNMGFDRFIDRSGMKYTDMCGYISDDALTNEIIDRYEERQIYEEEPFFCFGVSIANHVAMINREEFENTATHIDVTYQEDIGYSERRKQRVQEYIGGISKTGEALKKLTDYFEQQEEPTVIVFFGDHASNYAIDILKVKGEEELSYSTPYLIWSNYDLNREMGKWKEEQRDMNVSYLSTYLLRILDMPLTDQNYYNIALQNQYPVETRYIIRNQDGMQYEDFADEEQDNYFKHALDIKKHIPTLLEHSYAVKDIWSVR